MKNPAFLSVLADRFSGYVTFRHLGGVDARSQSQLLGPFDRFLYEEGFQGPWPTRDVVVMFVV
jgi:hypothetical protein